MAASQGPDSQSKDQVDRSDNSAEMVQISARTGNHQIAKGAAGTQERKQSTTPSKSKVRRRNAKQVKKARITAEFVKNIPEGVTYSPGSGPLIAKATAKNTGDDIVKVGDFIFDVELVSKATLISMRKFLPSEEYRLLKNRKSARLCRRKRKEERGTIS